MLSPDPFTYLSWQKLPHSFRSAVEDCLHLPSLQELHVGRLNFPLSILNKHTNINLFSLTGIPQIPKYSDATYPQLKSLSVEGITSYHRRPFITWAKQCIGNLQSLKYDYLEGGETGSDLLKGCSDTLEILYISFIQSPQFCELSPCFLDVALC
jgi:hypothetical protein